MRSLLFQSYRRKWIKLAAQDFLLLFSFDLNFWSLYGKLLKRAWSFLGLNGLFRFCSEVERGGLWISGYLDSLPTE